MPVARLPILRLLQGSSWLSQQQVERNRRPILNAEPRRGSAILRILASESAERALRYAVALAYFGYQRCEEFFGHAPHDTGDKTRSKLRELSADLGLYFIRQHGAIPCSLEMDTSGDAGRGFGRVGAAAALVAG